MIGMFKRTLKLHDDLKNRSVFLFGPRQTGKTRWIKDSFPHAPNYNLLLSDVFFNLSQRPHLIREEVLSKKNLKESADPIIIDEIQKLPILLDEVQHLIQEGYHFILTGSSARKLKRGGANLLGGRARIRELFPLVTAEVPDYDLNRFLNYGALPSIYLSDQPEEDLEAYVGTYLKEEVQAEGLVRRIENFSRFLQVAALYNSELVNFANVASDAGINQKTVCSYFEILQDTLLGTLLEPFTKTKKRKAIATAKFYFFDVGVSNLLAGRKHIQPKTELFGKALEHFIFTELRAYLSYQKDKRPLSYWRSTSDYEVDFLIDDEIAIEVKSTGMVTEKHLTGLKALSEDIKLKKKIVVSMDATPRKIGDIEVLPVADFLKELWDQTYQAH